MDNYYQPIAFLLCVSKIISNISYIVIYSITGDKHTFTAKTSKLSQISLQQTLYLDIVAANGNILQYAELLECGGILSGIITLPPGQVEYQLRGYDIEGNSFAHVIPNSIVIFGSPQLEIVLIGNPVVVLNKGETSLVRISIQNKMKGPESLTVSTEIMTPSEIQYEYISNQAITLTPQKAVVIQVMFNASQTLSYGQNLNWTFTTVDNCTDREVSISFNAIIKPSIEVTVVNTTKSTISLKWIPPSSAILGNITKYTLSMDFSNGTMTIITVDGDTTNFDLNDLLPFQLVYISIIAYTDTGETAEIAPFNLLTAEAGKYISFLHCIWETTTVTPLQF